ncbi:MAG: DUF6768 family protein [Gemmatimonadota bacterium]
MKPSNENIDVLIREALGQEDAELFEQLGEQSLLQKQIQVFRSQSAWMTAGMLIVGIAFMALGIYAAIRLYHAPDMREMIIWLAVFFFSYTTILGMKLWDWMEIERASVTREIKRLELRIAQLASALRETGSTD